MSSSSKPSQYPLLGFKDRHLEDDYLEYLVVASRARIILGYVTATLLYALSPIASFLQYDKGIQLQDDYRAMSDEEKEDFKENKLDGTWYRYFPPNSWSYSLVVACLVPLMFILGGFLIRVTILDSLY